MNITVFHKVTGQILRTAQVPVGMANLQIVGHDEDWLEGTYPDDQFYIDSYTPVPMGPQPSPAHVFNYTTKQWEDPRTLDDLKAAKNAAINAARLRANQTHFTFAGKQIATDPLSRSDIDGAHGIIVATGALPPGWPGGWKAINNEYVLIPDVPTWLAFYGAMAAQGTANFARSQALKAQLAAATTPAEVEAVPDW